MNQSIYFHHTSVSDEEQGKGTLDHQPQCSSNLQESSPDIKNGKARCFYCAPFLRKVRSAYALLWKHFVQAYTNYRVAKWSVWWALATCGYLQVINYIQLLWQTAVGPNDKIYNGAVDFIYAILGKEDTSTVSVKTRILFKFCKIKIERIIESILNNYSYIYTLYLMIMQSTKNK